MSQTTVSAGSTRRGPILIVGSIVLLCAGVAIPGIGKVRAEAGRMSCQQKIKFVGQWVHQYCDVEGRYPRATQSATTLSIDEGFSWLFEIEKYCEPHQRYHLVDRQVAWNSSKNADKLNLANENYRCGNLPAERSARMNTSFLGIAGVGPDAVTLPLTHPDAGIFGNDRVIKNADVPNTSSTILLMETMTGGPWAQGGPSTVRGIEPGLAFGPTAPFGSRHSEGGLFGTPGVNVGMADGSVRFVKNTVHQSVLESLARLRGEKLDW
jgi:prepilin-type processing-associated H-X9-DG protein